MACAIHLWQAASYYMQGEVQTRGLIIQRWSTLEGILSTLLVPFRLSESYCVSRRNYEDMCENVVIRDVKQIRSALGNFLARTVSHPQRFTDSLCISR